MSRIPYRTEAGLSALVLLALGFAAGAAEPAATPDKSYVVVVSETTGAAWGAVVEALVQKHKARVVRYAVDVEAAVPELAALKPDLITFVARPEEAGRAFVVKVHRLTRRLDDDPYTDALWGIVTGYDAADALRIAKRGEPLLIQRGASGAGAGHLGPCADGFASYEGAKNDFWVKKDGKTTQQKVEPDPAKSLAEGFNTLAPQVFYTSGHATEKDWQIGYNFPGGQFRCERGQLYALNTRNERFDINSPEPKVYLPMGNCLIGHINGQDCMATAWMHTGGVYQMFGYTAVTWFGYMGWGTGELFGPGQLSLAEAFFFNNQALVHKLQTQYPAKAGIEFETFDEGAVNYMIGRHNLTKKNAKGELEADKEPAGLLWDRDVVAFYGDPAWDARLPKQELPWRTAIERIAGERMAFTLTTLRDGTWPGRPIMAWLPQRLEDPKIVEDGGRKPVVTDNFILVPLSGAFKAGESLRIVFEGRLLARPDTKALQELDAFKKRAQLVPEKERPAVLDALLRAGKNREGLMSTLESLDGEARVGLAFLIANMPPQDLKELSGTRLAGEVRLAYQARDSAPWKKDIPPEIFLNDVLPYACLDEARDPWRQDFLDRFSARAWQCKTPGVAAVKLNAEIFKELNVQYHATKRPKPNQSPAESMKAGFASCTGLSVLLADACRACGIPARIAGIPEWKDKKGDSAGNHAGNHTWVEIWDGRWHYLGASEVSELDKTWFTEKTRGPAVDSSHPRHRIYASSFRKTGLAYVLPWSPEVKWVPAVDVTGSYKAP